MPKVVYSQTPQENIWGQKILPGVKKIIFMHENMKFPCHDFFLDKSNLYLKWSTKIVSSGLNLGRMVLLFCFRYIILAFLTTIFSYRKF